jgi:hypothetical protein
MHRTRFFESYSQRNFPYSKLETFRRFPWSWLIFGQKRVDGCHKHVSPTSFQKLQPFSFNVASVIDRSENSAERHVLKSR